MLLKVLSNAKGVSTLSKEDMLEQVTICVDRAIGYYMADNKLTREQMADQMHMSTNTLRWKREGKNEWALSEILELSEIVGKTPDELTGFKELVSV